MLHVVRVGHKDRTCFALDVDDADLPARILTEDLFAVAGDGDISGEEDAAGDLPVGKGIERLNFIRFGESDADNLRGTMRGRGIWIIAAI